MHKLCKAAGLSSGLTRTGNGARQILESNVDDGPSQPLTFGIAIAP